MFGGARGKSTGAGRAAERAAETRVRVMYFILTACPPAKGSLGCNEEWE